MSFPEFLRALDYRDPCPVQARLAGIAKGERDRELRGCAARVSELRPRLANRKSSMVDFVVLDGSSETAVEVKTTPTGHDRARIRKAFGSGIIISRGVLDLDDPVKIIPAERILWALDPAHS